MKRASATITELDEALAKMRRYETILRTVVGMMDKPPLKDDYDKPSVYHADRGRWAIVEYVREQMGIDG